MRAVTGLKEPRDMAIAADDVYVVTRDAIGRIDEKTAALAKAVYEELSCGGPVIGAGKAGLWIADAGGCHSPAQGASRNQYLNVARRLSVFDDPPPETAADRIWIPGKGIRRTTAVLLRSRRRERRRLGYRRQLRTGCLAARPPNADRGSHRSPGCSARASRSGPGGSGSPRSSTTVSGGSTRSRGRSSR